LGGEIIPQWCKDLGDAAALDTASFEAYSARAKNKRGEKFIVLVKQKNPSHKAGKKYLTSIQFRSGIKDSV
jgi:hypothetical protein